MSDSNVVEIDKSRMRELLTQYDQADTLVDERKLAMENAIKARSDIVALILEANGGKKKFMRAGKVLSIVVRGDTHFFRGMKESEDLTEV